MNPVEHLADLSVNRARSRQSSEMLVAFDHRSAPVRRAINWYAIVWLVEGGLRRWIFPDIADALLVIRDPLVVLIYILAYQAKLLEFGRIEIAAAVIASLGFFATFIVGHGNLTVATYGWRTLILHLPLMYVMGKSLDLRYLIWLSRWMLLAVLPMTLLLVAQFYSPPTALVNIGVGGVGTAGFSGALDRLRPPGTFSFIIGPVYFYSLATACLFLEIFRGKAPRWLLLMAGVGIIIACPVSISRLLLFTVLIVVITGMIALLNFHKLSARAIMRAAMPGLLAIIALSQLSVFQDGLSAFSSRWETSTTDEGGVSTAIFYRFFINLIDPIRTALDQPAFGHGLGMGTNVGAKLLIGQLTFLGGEAEWFRLIFEMGTILGTAFIFLRMIMCIDLFSRARIAWQANNPAPMILLSVAAIPIAEGQWGQPTSLGFAVFSGGLVLAATRVPRLGRRTLDQRSLTCIPLPSPNRSGPLLSDRKTIRPPG